MYCHDITREDLLAQHFPEALNITVMSEAQIDTKLNLISKLAHAGDLAPGVILTTECGTEVAVTRRVSYFNHKNGSRYVLTHAPWPDYWSVLGGYKLPDIDAPLASCTPRDLPNCIYLRSLSDAETKQYAQNWKDAVVSETGAIDTSTEKTRLNGEGTFNIALLYLASGFIVAIGTPESLATPADKWEKIGGTLWFDPFTDIDEDSFWNRSAPFMKVDAPPEPSTIDKFNLRYAYVTVGSKGRVLEEYTSAAGDLDFRLLDKETFITRNSAIQNQKGKPLAKLWLESKKRRTFEDIIFDPANKDPRFYNMWRGFSCTPLPGYNHLRFLDHILDNVSQGDEALYNWIIGWFAQIIQRPGEKIGTSLALRGVQGCGKTLVGQQIGKLIKPYYRIVADARHVTGNFNAHLAGTLLLQAEEAFWAGDKAAEGMLKHLVTSAEFLLERKGVDAVPVQNFTRLLTTTNHNWVVPAALEERRFAVVDVSDKHAQDAAYFGAIVRDLESDGYANLLHYLLNFDLGAVNLRHIPQTDALLDQKLESLEPQDKWWLECLQDGQIDAGHDWPAEIRVDSLYASYLHYCNRHGARRPLDGRQLGQALKKRVPAIKKIRKRDGDERYQSYVLPDLETCRDQFSAATRSYGQLFMVDS